MFILKMLYDIGKYRVMNPAVLADIQRREVKPELVYFIYYIIHFIKIK